jgi:hypothetical protein
VHVISATRIIFARVIGVSRVTIGCLAKSLQ